MYNDYSFANAIILFGALQGLLLIFFLQKKKKGNSLAFCFFTLFLFSLAYINLWYGLYFMGIHSIGTLSIIGIPYPYEFLMGIGFYFYIKSQKKTEAYSYKKEAYLFIPAIIYCLLEIYFYYISIKEGGNTIYRKLENSGFFTIVEFTRFIFNLTLGILTILFLNKLKQKNKLSSKENRSMNLLFLFSKFFILYSILSLLLTLLSFLINPSNVVSLYSFYLTFFINTIFLYWIGFIGYTKHNILFSRIGSTSEHNTQNRDKFIKEKLIQIMDVEEQFTQADFSISKLALATKISHKELSNYLNNVNKCNVSEFINQYRVEKVKTLIDNPNFNYYTLEAISLEAGFKSKSSFNSIFKKYIGITPSQYKKREQ